LYRVAGPVNLVRLAQLIDMARAPELLFAPWSPSWPQMLPQSGSLFDRLHAGDVLIHQPYESFDAVLALLRQAVFDPAVVAIKQTIYRTGSDLELLELLREGVRRGKEVMAVVELKARFDEEANINWAEALESAGAQVVYGVVGLKTHAKMLLITRREGRRMRRYGHLSTGNYNPRTARLYTDLSYLTADPIVTADMDQLFNHLASQNRLPRMRRLLVAPFHLHRSMLECIAEVGRAAAAGRPARIVAKMNALTDEALVLALMEAGAQGARIDLIVRGACILPAQVPGLTDNIRVCSVIGRFLEHSRVFYFAHGDEEALWLASADWMNRNMLRRVELAWPVLDPDLRQRIVDECLVGPLHDDRDAWRLEADGSYAPPPHPLDGHGVQDALMQRYASRAARIGGAPRPEKGT
jgi:polyphosphate kinase